MTLNAVKVQSSAFDLATRRIDTQPTPTHVAGGWGFSGVLLLLLLLLSLFTDSEQLYLAK